MPVTVAVAAAAVAIGRGGSRLALLNSVSCDVALRDVGGEMLQLSSSSAVFPSTTHRLPAWKLCADLMKPHRGQAMPRSGSAPYIIFISSIYIIIANVRLRVPRERVVQLSEPEEVAYDRVQGSDELVRVELLQRLVRVGEHRREDPIPRGRESVHLVAGGLG